MDPKRRMLVRKSKSCDSLVDSSNVDVLTPQNTWIKGRRNDRSVDQQVAGLFMSTGEEECENLVDSGLASEGDMLYILQHKVDQLCEMLQEHSRLIQTLTEDFLDTKIAIEHVGAAQTEISDYLKNAVGQSKMEHGAPDIVHDTENNARARSLLNAIEVRQHASLDKEIKDALTNYLQSNELNELMVSVTAETVKDVIGERLSRDVSELYLPVLEASNRSLVRHISRAIEDAFDELEKGSDCLNKSVFKISKSLRRSIERHQHSLEATFKVNPQKDIMNTLKGTVEELLHNEIKQWRHKMVDIFSSQAQVDAINELGSPPIQLADLTPPQTPNADRSMIDQLMMGAEAEGAAASAALERALCAGQLARVVAACRRGPAARCLPQPALLALLQQLSTDLRRDTTLKCRYLEDAIVNLNPKDPITRSHLPMVVGEVRKYLSNFLSSNPNHPQYNRVTLIVMAANYLLNPVYN